MSYHKYIFQPRPLEAMVQDTDVKVVVDTNVLLAAYQWRDVTLDEILHSLKRLSAGNRLVIPSHVMKEFSRRRPGLIVEMINRIDQQISQKFQRPNDVSELVPALSRTSFVARAKRARQRYISAGEAYQTELNHLKDHLSDLFIKDRVMDEYSHIFSAAWYEPDDFPSITEVEAEAARRYKENIPPGYKDAKKEGNAAGDFIIWKHILSLNCDTIFVSFDNKPDWVIATKDKVISARRELVEEFYDECGKSFHIVSPKEFFPLLRPDMSAEIREDLGTPPTIELDGLIREYLNNKQLSKMFGNYIERKLTNRSSTNLLDPGPSVVASPTSSDFEHCIICGGPGPLVKGLCEKCSEEFK